MTFVRYVFIQVLAYSIDMGAFLIVLSVGVVGPILANVISKFAAGLFAFVAHRRFTFRATNGESVKEQAVKYFVLLTLNIPLASAILALLLMWLPGAVLAKLIADMICIGLTYFLSKYFIFTRQPKQAKSDSIGLDL